MRFCVRPPPLTDCQSCIASTAPPIAFHDSAVEPKVTDRDGPEASSEPTCVVGEEATATRPDG